MIPGSVVGRVKIWLGGNGRRPSRLDSEEVNGRGNQNQFPNSHEFSLWNWCKNNKILAIHSFTHNAHRSETKYDLRSHSSVKCPLPSRAENWNGRKSVVGPHVIWANGRRPKRRAFPKLGRPSQGAPPELPLQYNQKDKQSREQICIFVKNRQIVSNYEK